MVTLGKEPNKALVKKLASLINCDFTHDKKKKKTQTTEKLTPCKRAHSAQGASCRARKSLFPTSTRTVYHGLPPPLDSQIPAGSRSSLANVLLLTCGHP